jgi:pimeloyl-ACP methyl ester carboxylesterase
MTPISPGHSFGARAALLFEMREPWVAALVSLDGEIGTARYIHDTGLRLLRSLDPAERWLVPVPAMHHQFASLGAASMAFPRFRSALAATSATSDQYGSVRRATLDFTDGLEALAIVTGLLAKP